MPRLLSTLSLSTAGKSEVSAEGRLLGRRDKGAENESADRDVAAPALETVVVVDTREKRSEDNNHHAN
jgi:hypothetical protein